MRWVMQRPCWWLAISLAEPGARGASAAEGLPLRRGINRAEPFFIFAID
jgi:hypothetical protein